jgi:hypothetical protein
MASGVLKHARASSREGVGALLAFDRRNGEGPRLLAALVNVPHGYVGALDMPTKSFGVEQWGFVSIVRKFLLNATKQLRICSKPYCKRLVVCECMRYQLWQSNRGKQAACHAGRHCFARARDHWQARHKASLAVVPAL